MSVALKIEDVGLREAAGGDEGAFRALVEGECAELHAHCYRMLGSLHDADDALQETLLRAWRALPGFRGRSSVRTWLYRIATNVCFDAIARRPKRVLPLDYGPLTGPRRATAIQRLPPRAWIEPYPDEALGIADGAVRSRGRATSDARRSSWPSSRRCSTCRPASARC